MGYLKRVLVGVGSVGFAGLSVACAAARADTPPAPGTEASELAALRADVTALRDDEAIRALGTCYARGLDAIAKSYADRTKGMATAEALYARCFAADVQISVYPVAAKTPFKQTRGIKEWVEFADGFYASVGYSSTRHLTSNFFVEHTGAGTARMTSYAVGPHFLKSAAKDAASAAPTLEYYSLRYVDDVAKQADGTWRVVSKSVYFDEVWRGVGFFPNGNSDGS